MFGRIGVLVRTASWLAIGELALGLSRVLSRILHKLEDTLPNGPKEQAALDSLDAAIADLEAWRDAEDENDAGQIAARTDRIKQLMGARPGEAIDALTGVPVPVNRPASEPDPPVPVEDDEETDNN